MPSASQGAHISSSGQVDPGSILGSDIANGTITDANVNAAAAIAQSKLALSIANADVAAGAAIVDTKLAAISTPGKVSGAALTSLGSIPGGAGTIPSANLPAFSAEAWVDEGTLTWSAETTDKTLTPTNTGKRMYLFLLEFDAASAGLLMRFNGDTSANYYYRTISASAVADVVTQTSMQIISATAIPFGGAIYAFTKPGAATNMMAKIDVGGGNGSTVSMMGRLNVNGDFASFTFMVGGGTITGKIHCFSYNF